MCPNPFEDLKAAIDRRDDCIMQRNAEIDSLKEELATANEAVEQWKSSYEREREKLLCSTLDLDEAKRKITAWMVAESEAKKKIKDLKTNHELVVKGWQEQNKKHCAEIASLKTALAEELYKCEAERIQLECELESVRKATMADAVQSATGKASADGRTEKLEQTVIQLVEVLSWVIADCDRS